MKKRIFIVLMILLITVIAILIIVPMLNVCRTPGWGEDSGEFLYSVGKALQMYSSAHEGQMPSTLASLYPEYIDDNRVIKQTSLFSHKRMGLIYWHPQKMGDARVPVAQLVLDPSVETDYQWRNLVLWGDGHVRLYPTQRK
jgi:hypothetical protein